MDYFLYIRINDYEHPLTPIDNFACLPELIKRLRHIGGSEVKIMMKNGDNLEFLCEQQTTQIINQVCLTK